MVLVHYCTGKIVYNVREEDKRGVMSQVVALSCYGMHGG